MRKNIFGALMAPVVAFGLAACSVEQTEEGEAPTVDVEGGNLPEYDVQPADVDVNIDSVTVPVPDVDVNTDSSRDTTPR